MNIIRIMDYKKKIFKFNRKSFLHTKFCVKLFDDDIKSIPNYPTYGLHQFIDGVRVSRRAIEFHNNDRDFGPDIQW